MSNFVKMFGTCYFSVGFLRKINCTFLLFYVIYCRTCYEFAGNNYLNTDVYLLKKILMIILN